MYWMRKHLAIAVLPVDARVIGKHVLRVQVSAKLVDIVSEDSTVEADIVHCL